MTRIRSLWIALLVMTLMMITAALPATAAQDLAGLWEARLRFGPDLRGSLIVSRNAQGWSADFAGRTIPAREERGVISFELPDGEGSFRGRFDESDIAGHWTQAKTTFSGLAYATPVRLTAEAPGRWRGEVQPFEDFFTLYLMLQPRDDGSYNAFVRNPERNFAIYWNLTRLTHDGRVVRLLRGDPPETLHAEGIYDKERDILTFPLRGGTYDFARGNGRSHVYPRGKTPERYVYHPPLARNDGWPTGALDEVGIDRAAIEAFIQSRIDTPIDSIHTAEDHGVLIVRHGKLVLEEYFHGEHRDKLHETRSAAKSLTATLVGAAIEAGAPFSTSTPVYEIMYGGTFPPSLEARKKAMTVEHLLTMSSGFDCDDNADPPRPGSEDLMMEQTDDLDWYRYTLNLPMADAPGEKTVYCSTNPNLLGGVLRRATGETLTDLFDRLIAKPMQFGRYALFLSPLGDAYMGGGVHVLPRDFMKLGQMMLDGGTWHGRRILSREFTTRASSPLRTLGSRAHYGYLWWVFDYPYKDRQVRAYSANGNGGQALIVVPELDLVVMFYGGNYTDDAGWDWHRLYIPKYVLPAVK